MAAEARVRQQRPLWATRNGILLAAAIVSSAIAWWMIAWPVATLSNVANHQGHFALTFAHMVGGTGMLTLGGLNLYLAARNNSYPLHRKIGRAYLAFGTFGAVVALVITLSPAHKSAGSPIDQCHGVAGDPGYGLAVLRRAGLASGAQPPLHLARALDGPQLRTGLVLRLLPIASRVSNIDDLGGGEAFIWLSWVSSADRLRNGAALARRGAKTIAVKTISRRTARHLTHLG